MIANHKFFRYKLPNLSKFCQMKLNCWLFRFLPFWVSRWYLAILGRLYYFINQPERRLIRRTITHIWGPKLKAPELKVMVSRAFQGIFDHYHEKLVVAYSRLPGLKRFLRSRIRAVGEEILQEALAVGKGVLLVTGHFGAVELLPGFLGVQGYQVSMICRFKTGHLRNSLLSRAAAANVNLIDAEGENTLLAAIRALKQGQILITECDEFDEWRVSQHREIRFLGSPLAYDRTLDILCKRSGSPVVTGFMKRNGSQKYSLDFTAITNGRETGNSAIGERCLKVLEEAIQAAPEQWYQWKKFGTMIKIAEKETAYDHQESGYLAPQFGF